MPSTGNILEVAPQGEKGGEHGNQILSPSSAEGLEFWSASQRGNRHTAQSVRNRAAEHVLGLEVADLAAGNAPVKDSPLVGNEGVSGTVEGHGDRVSVCETRQPVTSDVKSGRSEHQASPADSQINQGLTIERLIDSAIRAEEHAAEIEQLRAEENDAAEEGALIDASGYNDPAYGVPR